MFLIVISPRQYSKNTMSAMPLEDLRFPQEEDLTNYSLSFMPAEMIVPHGLLTERLQQENASSEGLYVQSAVACLSFMLY